MRKCFRQIAMTVFAVFATIVVIAVVNANDNSDCPTSLFGITVGDKIASDIKPAEVHDKYLSFAFEPDKKIFGISEYRANATLSTRTIYGISGGYKTTFAKDAQKNAELMMKWVVDEYGGQFFECECKSKNIKMWKCSYFSSGIFRTKREVGAITVSIASDPRYERYVVSVQFFVTEFYNLQIEESAKQKPTARILNGKPPRRDNSGNNFSLDQYLFENPKPKTKSFDEWLSQKE